MLPDYLRRLVDFFNEVSISECSVDEFSPEYEVRILDIDKQGMIEKIISLNGAELVNNEMLQRRYIFDYPNGTLRENSSWVRLRSVGREEIELTLKKRGSGSDFEKTVLVSGFEETKVRLEAFGLVVTGYQENIRTTFKVGKIIFDLDTWPMINPYIEIEAPSKEMVLEGVLLLGFTEADATHLVGEALFRHYGIDLASIKELSFD